MFGSYALYRPNPLVVSGALVRKPSDPDVFSINLDPSDADSWLVAMQWVDSTDSEVPPMFRGFVRTVLDRFRCREADRDFAATMGAIEVYAGQVERLRIVNNTTKVTDHWRIDAVRVCSALGAVRLEDVPSKPVCSVGGWKTFGGILLILLGMFGFCMFLVLCMFFSESHSALQILLAIYAAVSGCSLMGVGVWLFEAVSRSYTGDFVRSV